VKGGWLKHGAPRQEPSRDQMIARHTEKEIVVQGLSLRLHNDGLPACADAAIRSGAPTSPLHQCPSGQPVRTDTQAAETAVILDFPGAGPSQRELATPIIASANHRIEKATLRVALAAIRAKMTLEQVEQLDRHEAILHGFTHFFEVYLAPERFVDVAGLVDDEQADPIEKMRLSALRVLLPTERDTLHGALRTLTHSLQQTVTLKRRIVGLGDLKTKSNAGGFPDPWTDEDRAPPLVDLSTMSTEDLRTVQRGMELLERHQHVVREPPIPPRPDPIDDLYEASAPGVEPDKPRLPSR
jgi:hypothetical protein